MRVNGGEEESEFSLAQAPLVCQKGLIGFESWSIYIGFDMKTLDVLLKIWLARWYIHFFPFTILAYFIPHNSLIGFSCSFILVKYYV